MAVGLTAVGSVACVHDTVVCVSSSTQQACRRLNVAANGLVAATLRVGSIEEKEEEEWPLLALYSFIHSFLFAQ